MFIVGFDPGGAKAFGWAVLRLSAESFHLVAGGVCSGVEQALSKASLALSGEIPVAVGIDAPLFWSSRGDRYADAYVRKAVCASGGHGGTVGHVNSLRGACLVEGAIAARLSHERWPAALITEAHPKALIKVNREAKDFADGLDLQGDGHHMRDAALGAFAARCLVEKTSGWLDLVGVEHAPLHPFGVPVAYWFPRT